MDSTARMNIVTPAEGLMVFDSTYNSFYFHDGTTWSAIGSGGGSDNLGDHIATQNLQLKDNWLNNDGDADEGIYIDTLGNVGIGEKTNSTFHVKINDETVSQVMAGNSSIGFGLVGNPAVYQTFTANATDSITNVSVAFRDAQIEQDKVINIYEGTGTGGTLLFTSAPVFVPSSAVLTTFDFPVSNVEVTNGQIYSIYIADGGGVAFSTGGYDGGALNLGVDLDMIFSITSFHIDQNPGLSVSDSGIELNNYSIPLADGSPGQILATDGSGNLNWTSPSANTDSQQLTLSNDSIFLTNSTAAINLNPYLDNTDNQQLTISNDSLFLTNNITAIDLSAFMDADNLGNHTATQDITIGNNWIRKDSAGTSGFHFDIYERAVFESNSTVPAIFKSKAIGSFNESYSGYIEINNKAGTRALFGVDGNGFTGGDTTDVVLGNFSNGHLNLYTNGSEKVRIDSIGRVGIGGSAGTHGAAKLELHGPPASNEGPHTQFVTSTDDYPVFQQLNWDHDNIALVFDGHYNTNTSWTSSSSSGNYNIYKAGTRLVNYYDGNVAAGSGIIWNIGTSLDTLGRFGIGRHAITNKLEVEGNASKTSAGSWLANSDARLKKNITSLSSEIILEKMLSLQGVTYEWNDNKTNTKRPEGIQYGFTAQNIQEVFPSLVTEDNNGFLQTPYGTYDAMTVEAIRALNDKIELQNQEIIRLKVEKENSQATLNNVLNRLDQLEANNENNVKLINGDFIKEK